MATETNEPRALTAALAAPAFATRGAGMAMHAANRHVERWAPEGPAATRSRSMRSLGFVDRLVAPWMETAQRSASMRVFSQYARAGASERQGGAVSWVFPRPWYQDELDWMAAARQAGSAQAAGPSMFTTRGTYVPAARSEVAAPRAELPSALYEYVAPSLSIAAPSAPAGVGYGGSHGDAYSSLVPLAAVQAAELMSRAVAPLMSSSSGGPAAPGRMSPALRNVLTTMLERATAARVTSPEPTRLAMHAPELVTPPAPRADDQRAGSEQATRLADQYAEQRAQILDVQRIARQSAERELAARIATRPEAPVEARAVQAEAELRQRAGQAADAQQRQAAADAQQRQAAGDRAAGDRARIEERIAQRIAERTQTQRLHEQARTEATAHARATELAPTASTDVRASERRAPAEVTAAIAALPPALATFLGQRPERAMQVIAELNDSLRAVELMARSAAAGTAFEATRGPRLMMPAGLGGLVAAVDRAQSITDRPASLTGQRPLAPPIGTGNRGEMRVPAMSFVAGPRPSTSTAPSTALGATASAAPVALTHVAWADRWLARFAGATPQSLDVLQAASGSPEMRMQALAAAAPHAVFVAPMFDNDRSDRVRFTEAGHPVVGPRASAPVPAPATPQAAAPVPAVVRYDDDAETPDDVFASIAAAATRSRTQVAPSAPVPTAPPVAERAFERFTAADAVAHAAPVAPGAGLSAHLASSPFASALRHVMPLPSAASFDVRALFGAGLSATYLAGLLGPASSELEVAGAGTPSWMAPDVAAMPERAPIDWDPAYVAPESQPELRDGDVAASAQAPDVAAIAASIAPLTTLRTALLSWNVDAAMPTFADAPTVTTGPTGAITGSAARAMIEAMSLPMLGESSAPDDRGTSWASPGMVAERAHGWSVAQERSSSDLSLDFVTPELVLAARVYGLGPAEAAQAARLAIAGPGHLSAMAGSVDRTFVQAMAIEADRRVSEGRASSPAAITTAYPTAGGDLAAAIGPAPRPAAFVAPPSTGTAFGVDRRAPRGAFLWPAATVAALGLNAAGPDGQQSMSVAALELLAAQAVAEIGTYAALSEKADGRDDALPLATSQVAAARGGVAPLAGPTMSRDAAEPGETDVLEAAAALVPVSRRARFDALYVALSQTPSGRTWSPAARAARALALAGRGDDAPVSARDRAATAWDVLPVVYATEGMSNTEADQYVTTAASFGGGPRPATATRRGGRGGNEHVAIDTRAGLGGLAGRAGEALSSYVTPATAPGLGSTSSQSSSSQRETPAMRASNATQEMVRTGRPTGRYGGGEVEIPSWFEAAARKMLDDRGGGGVEGISMAELTLVSAAPASHIAASTRSAPSAAPPSPSSGGAASQSGHAPQIDIEKTANEVYRQILVLMDAARARNGEPYL